MDDNEDFSSSDGSNGKGVSKPRASTKSPDRTKAPEHRSKIPDPNKPYRSADGRSASPEASAKKPSHPEPILSWIKCKLCKRLDLMPESWRKDVEDNSPADFQERL